MNSAAKLDKDKIKDPNEVRAYKTALAQTYNMYDRYQSEDEKYLYGQNYRSRWPKQQITWE